MARFFYKNNETSSLSFKKLILFTESHYSAKAPQNMKYKEQSEFKKTLLFQIYHSLNLFWKMYPFYNFCQFFTIFGYILHLTQKLRCTKEIYDLDDSLAWKKHYIRSLYSKYLFEILSKSIFENNYSIADIICMIITEIPLKKT